MNRKRRLNLFCLILPAALCLFGAWRIYPDAHQRWLDNQLFAAIYRHDAKVVSTLLAQGANPNARGDEAMAWRSLWHFLRARWGGQHTNTSSRHALDAALFNHNPLTESTRDGPIITILLEHGAELVTPDRTDVKVYKGHFHHGSHSPYVGLDWFRQEVHGAVHDVGVTIYPMTETQADAFVRAALKAGAHPL